MIKKYNPQKIQLHRTYTVGEAADALGIDKHTVQRWVWLGHLKTVGGKPYLIHGQALRAFLRDAAKRRKFQLGADEFLCFRCHAPRKSKPECLRQVAQDKALAKGNASIRIEGICEACGGPVMRYDSSLKTGGVGFVRAQPNPSESPHPGVKNMPVFNVQNEGLKRRYQRHLKGARGYSEDTIKQRLRAIDYWEEFNQFRGFVEFSIDGVEAFKKYIGTHVSLRTQAALSLTTQHNILTAVKEFYKWLSDQQGYKRAVDLNKVAFFSLSRAGIRMANEFRDRQTPTLATVKEVIRSIKGDAEVDLRDRAMLAFAIMTGVRIDVIASLPLKAVDLETMTVLQDPAQGTRTKFKKRIRTTMMGFDAEFVEIFRDWAIFLRETMGFSDNDPLFPKALIEQTSDENTSFSTKRISRHFWSNSNGPRNALRRRFKEAHVPHCTPHSLRRAAITEAVRRCRTPIELKAVSMNCGHEDIRTTLAYVALSPEEVSRLIGLLTSDRRDSDEEAMKKIQEAVDQLKGRL